MPDKKINAQKRILILESDSQLRNSLKRLLEKEHFQVYACHKLDQAKTKMNASTFNLIILGLNLPKSSSITVLKRVLSASYTCEILVLSAFNLNEIQKEYQLYALKHVLIKPIKKEAILESIYSLEI